MSKEIYISSTPHETRLAICENDALTEIYYERENEYTLAGSIYNGKVTRVLPGMQSSFVDIGLERDAFLYITDFMEDTGDSEEYDTSDGAKPARVEGAGRERGGRGDRGGNRDRTPRLAAPAAEPTDDELFTAAVADVEPIAAPRGDGGDRDRNRGRGGRNRGRDRDRKPDAGRGLPPRVAAPAAEPESFMQPSVGNDADEVGEGAPGADGSRRWRGRRGRRGGRGPGGVAGVTEQGAAVDAPMDADTSLDLYAAEAAPFVPPAAVVAPVARVEAPVRTERPRNDGGRSDRGGRGGRGDGRGDRGGRDRGGREGGGRDGRAPRGFEPRVPSYVSAGEPEEPVYGREVYAEAPKEPVILPGESLGKYRAASEPVAAAKPAGLTPLPPPSTEFTLPTAWDGGFVLPGESLSRRRGAETKPAMAASQPAPVAVAPMVAPVVADPEAKAVVEPVAEIQHEPVAVAEAEYEPVEAAASFRVDAAPVREFRQAAPVVEVEEPVVEVPEVVEHEVTAIHASGEMVSEAPALVEHVAEAVDVVPEVHAETHTTSVAPPPVPAPYFEPGTGDLEEEELEDEEFEVPSMHAHSGHEEEDEDGEEETLEGAADLGVMLREMSIDEITGPEEDEDGEDFEEDLVEEDQELGYDVDDEAPSEEELEDFEDSEDSEEDGAEVATGDGHVAELTVAAPAGEPREPRRDSFRRDGRRDGRGGRDRNRSRSTGGAERSDMDRGSDRGRRDGRGGRQSAQMTNLPAISDLLKPGQEILVQIAKEPIAKKGARITSHIALPGRFLVFMPTVGHTGVSRKIESDQERRRLKEILLSEKGEASGGFIVRTAAEGASEEELRSDLRFLLNLWSDIKNRSESSKSPALIYHDLNLVERVLRDQVTDTFSAIWVDTESEYERVLRFLQRFQPSLIRRVKLYTKETPLFEQFGITEEINKALRSKVWLKSGGSIVINQTEALVAIDINTGKYVGKTARLEDTIVKTNLDAIPEIVRQIRLRDLGGIIIIDFIDMDERKNRNRVMAALEEELKSDRAPSKVLQFNDFGLVAITRKRVKQSLERTLSTTCGVCAGTGMVKSPITVCNDIYVEMRKMHKHLDRGDVMLRVHPEVVKQLKSGGTNWLHEMEEMCGKTILVKSDPSLHPEQFDIH